MATVARVRGHNTRSRLLGLAGRGLAALTLTTAAFLPTAVAATVPPALGPCVPPAQPPGCYLALNQPPVVPPNAPPGGSTLIAFPSRDFVSTIGYVPGMTYTVNVIRNGVTIGTSEPSVADATGAINVNHPGGSCWIGQTPDLRPGDLVRITDRNGFANQTTIANVTAQAPVVVKAATPGSTVADGILQVHGTAQTLPGVVPVAPLPLAQVENRLVANKDAFLLNGRRTLRAGGAGKDGTLAYDPVDPVTNPHGFNWTATYHLTEVDLARAVGGTAFNPLTQLTQPFTGAQSRAIWLGSDPVALTENTIYEVPDAVTVKGPTPPCTAPAQVGPTVAAGPVGGVYNTPQKVTLTASDPTATINFTTDGTAPSTALGAAPGPVSVPITANTTLKFVAVDPAGGVSSIGTETYVIDSVAPTVNITVAGTVGAGTTYRSAVNATISAADNPGGSGLASLTYTLDGVATSIANNGVVSVTSNGTHTLTATATDLAGNTSAVTSQTFSIDTVAPTLGVALAGTQGMGNAYRSAVTATITASDGGSGLASLQYVLDSGAATTIASGATVSVTGAGAHNLQVTATDLAGNSTTSTSLPTIDLTPPTASIALAGTQGTGTIYRSPVAVSFSASDNPGGTGLGSVQYSLDGGPLTPTASGASILVSGDGAHTVQLQATDVAGNTSTPVSQSFSIDTVAPTANLALAGTGNGSIFRGAVTATISGADNASGSGLATLQYTLDGGPATPIASGGTVVVSANGTHTLTAAATDFAGNTSTPMRQTFTIDTLAPTASIALAGTQDIGTNYLSSVVATINASDNAGGTGLTTLQYTLDGGPATPVASGGSVTVSTNGTHTLSATATDFAGNTSTAPSQTFTIASAPAPSGGGGSSGGSAQAPAPGSNGGGSGSSAAVAPAAPVTSSSSAPALAAQPAADAAAARASDAAPAPVPAPVAEPAPGPAAEPAPEPVAAEAPAPVTPQGPVTASIDPAQGGVLSLADGALSVSVPVDASSDVLTLSLGEVPTGSENLRIGSHLYLLTAQDSAGAGVTSFSQALQLTFVPSATDLAAVNGDLSAFAVWFLDPETGEFDSLPTTVSSDGASITVDLDRIGVAAASADTTTPVDTSEVIDAPDQSDFAVTEGELLALSGPTTEAADLVD